MSVLGQASQRTLRNVYGVEPDRRTNVFFSLYLFRLPKRNRLFAYLKLPFEKINFKHENTCSLLRAGNMIIQDRYPLNQGNDNRIILQTSDLG